jgi:hypothetical protein
MKRIPKAVQNVIDVIDHETAAKLLASGDEKGEHLLFVNVYDAISDSAMNGTPLTQDQREILLLPFKAWGSDAGKRDPREHELYGLFEQTRVRIQGMSINELGELAASVERLEILEGLRSAVDEVFSNLERLAQSKKDRPRRSRRRAGAV